MTCGKPVVVEKRRKLEEPAYRGRWDRTSTRRVLCLNHLTKLVTGDSPSKSADDVERRAAEKVVMRHWDEYQAELKRIREDAREAVFSELPDDLRSAVVEKLRADEEL
ncbi:hypothetical protein BJF89_01190 [Corynebacterium sp. CNJ-954]|nr:hypothetical protein BJF89_01190 [Corynebacterium sp. CNJ-954]